LRVVLPFLPLVAVAAKNDDSLGQKLGVAVLNTVQGIQKQGSDYESTIMDILASKQEVLSSPEISKAIAVANSLAEQQRPTDPTCERDWTQACPDGWDLLAPEGGCSAPTSYSGGCGASFGAGATVQAKLEFAATCSAPWPCAGNQACSHGTDYEKCPLGWLDVGGGYCQGKSSSTSKCGSLFNFAAMAVAQKQEMAKDCGVQWACKEQCEQDFNAQCPAGWSSIDDLCVAPASYAGECDYSVDTTDLTAAEKQTFASHCGVKFPCVGSGAVLAGVAFLASSSAVGAPQHVVLHPPEPATAHEAEDALATLATAEGTKQDASMKAFDQQSEEILKASSAAIRHVVAAAFMPLRER